jgi:hypothetical protein
MSLYVYLNYKLIKKCTTIFSILFKSVLKYSVTKIKEIRVSRMKMYTVEVCIDERKITRVEASDSVYDIKKKYLDLYPNSTVRVISKSTNNIYFLFGAIILMAIILFIALIIGVAKG